MTDQSSKWHATRDAKLKELFGSRQFTIVDEFKNKGPFKTPLGYKVKSGWHLAATDGSMECVVGKSLLDYLVDSGKVEKPAAKKRGRPRKQPLEQAEEWASRDIPKDAQQITQPGPTYVNPNADEEAK